MASFQIKDFASITVSAINWMRAVTRKVTDFNKGSIVRTVLESFGNELDEFYQRMFIGIRQAIPVSVYNSFDFARILSTSANGLVRFMVTAVGTDTNITAGTVFSVPGRTVVYRATQDVTISAGGTFADIPVAASVSGSIGNLPAATGFTVNPVPSNFLSASNLGAFLNGQDQETDAQRKLRFNEFIQSLERGTLASVRYGAKQAKILDSAGNVIEQVVKVATIEPYLADPAQPIAWVQVFVHNGSGGTSAALVAKVAQVIAGYTDSAGVKVPGWKAAGARYDYAAATEQSLKVAGVITAADGYVHGDLVGPAAIAIAQYLLGLDIGESAIQSEIVKLVKQIPGVYDFVISTPTGNTVVAANVKIMPGVIAVDSPILTPSSGSMVLTGNLVVRV